MNREPTGRGWSMKTDRELIALSKTHTLEAVVEHFQRTPEVIRAKAVRLGLSIKRKGTGK
jgi:hypothetical protein